MTTSRRVMVIKGPRPGRFGAALHVASQVVPAAEPCDDYDGGAFDARLHPVVACLRCGYLRDAHVAKPSVSGTGDSWIADAGQDSIADALVRGRFRHGGRT